MCLVFMLDVINMTLFWSNVLDPLLDKLGKKMAWINPIEGMNEVKETIGVVSEVNEKIAGIFNNHLKNYEEI